MLKNLRIVLALIAALSLEIAEAKEFGLGVMLGGPTGVSGNYYLTDDTSLDFGLGVGLGSRNVHLHGTYLFHMPEDITFENYSFGWYFGAGARFATRDTDEDKTLLGPRGSIGFNFPLKTESGREFDIFVEAALNVSIIGSFYSDLDGAVGGRYYF
ncbi:MAG: hypothetical protein HRT45_00315 [Bdellovibrionales bacterium]|nr:hypothetical protein [Bdellovibrionales bacterium]